jgi:hypothetical protein
MGVAQRLESIRVGEQELLDRVRTHGLKRWEQIEPDVISWLSEETHGEVAAAVNSIFAQLIQNGSRRSVGRNVSCGSTLLPNVDVDLCYPADGIDPVVGASVNVLTPVRRGRARITLDRDAFSARVQQAAWMSLDFKLQHAVPAPISSISCWAREVKPWFFSLWLVHVASDAEFVERRAVLNALRHHCNGVGALFFGPDPRQPNRFMPLRAGELEIDSVLHEMVAGVTLAER